LVNSVVAGAVVGLFGLEFSSVRSVLHAVVDSATAVLSATKGRVYLIALFSLWVVTG
jgi:hypothetical protein